MTVNCRFCNTPLEQSLVDLGSTPLANSNLRSPDEFASERSFPLHVMVCGKCFLVQTTENIPADAIFHDDYAYFSSFSAGWVAHAKRYCEDMTTRFGLGSTTQVVEVASNDGYLLQHFVALGVPALGVEPADNCAEEARKKGVETLTAFFNAETARKLVDEGRAADLTAANNVLAHVPDINDFVAGFKVILKPEGVSTFEFPHLLNLINLVQFDTIYHEHYSYLSVTALDTIMAAHGLRLFDVQKLPTHGGSLRLFVCHDEAAHTETDALRAVRAEEKAAGLDTLQGYQGFPAQVERVTTAFMAFLSTALAEGKTVAGYGAAAKGNTFLNACGATADQLQFVADRNVHKQNRFLPGVHAPIIAPEEIAARKPDYLVILPWNLADEVASECAFIREWGGQFVTAIPELRIF